MKVTHILRRFDKNDWGGIEAVCLNLCKELLGLNIDVEILCTNAMSERDNDIYEDIQVSRFPYFYPYIFFNSSKKDQFDRKGGNPLSPSLIKHLKDVKPELIHLHTMGFLGAQVIRFAKKHKIPVVISLHGGHFDVSKNESSSFDDLYKGTLGYGRFFKPIINPSEVVENSDGVVCVGKNEEILAKKSLPKKHVAYIPNGVDLNLFNTKIDKNFYSNLLGISSEKKVLLYQSRIDGQKNQIQLIHVAHELKKLGLEDNYHFYINGPVMNESYFKNMKHQAKELGVEKQISFNRGVEPGTSEHVQSFLNAEAFLFPTLHEPFGIVALEAWAAKVPVLCSGVGGLEFVVSNEVNGLIIDPEDPELWAKKIASLDSVRNDLVQSAFIEVSQNYSWNQCGIKTKEFYETTKQLF
jgi:glycosyltransferase involved in cell wall biosynthesis